MKVVMWMQDVAVFGTGDFGRVAASYITDDAAGRVVCLIADDPAEASIDGLNVFSYDAFVERFAPGEVAVYCAVGYSARNRKRRGVVDRFESAGYALFSFVDSSVRSRRGVVIGPHAFVFECNVIQPNVRIGRNAVLWSGNHIGHDSVVGDDVFIASHVVVSGNCTIGDGVFLGVNSTLRDGVTVGDAAVVGAGALVLDDVPANAVVAAEGTPDRRQRRSAGA
jgi:sugar O-acyltransferase (sialic acid O-acetyltransferase NeuD family)